VFVIDGGRVRVRDEGVDEGVDDGVDERASTTARWLPGAPARHLENVGTTTYRELAVELK
jgi:hypothetical protein